MHKRFPMASYGPRLWTRDAARPIRHQLEDLLEAVQPGDVIIIDMKGIEAFDYSFANEFFGKTLLALPRTYPGRFVVIEGLNQYTRENLIAALHTLSLAAIERSGRTLELIGKFHPADTVTFTAIAQARTGVTAAQLRDLLAINLAAVNERLAKLTSLGLVRRRPGSSPAGREQYEYSVLA
jgi:hypothetical protein